MFLEPNGEDLEKLADWVDEGKIAPVIGSTINIRDIDKVREACMLTYKGMGGIGKTVLEVY